MLKSWLEETKAYSPERPYILAEFGAGTDERILAHEPTIYDMSPQYAHKFHAHYQSVLEGIPWIAGQFIWTWSDFQRTSLGDCMKHMNNKGMVNNRREPKDMYWQYRAIWTEAPFVQFAEKSWSKRAGFSTRSDALLINETIRIYSNVKEVELSLNGKVVGVAKTENGSATFEVLLSAGDNQLVARAGACVDVYAVQADVFPGFEGMVRP